MKRSFLLLGMLLLLLAACGGEDAASNDAGVLEPVPTEYAGVTNPYGSEALTEGGKLFESFCVSCHGKYGHGDGVAGASLDPKPKNLAELQAQVTDDYLFWRISTGKPGTSMVAWNGILTEDQIWQIVVYIRALK